MLADLSLAQRIRPVASAAQALADRYADSLMEAESEAWRAATARRRVRLVGLLELVDPRRGPRSSAASEPRWSRAERVTE